MEIGYYKEKTNKNLHAATHTIDDKGNLYLRFISSQHNIYKFNKRLNKIEEIEISPFTDQLKNELGLTSYDGIIRSNRGIFATLNNYLVLGNLRITVVDENGNFIQNYPMGKKENERMDKISLAPIYRLDNGKIILHANTGNGSILAISDKVRPDYSDTLPVKSIYLNHTNFFENLEKVPNMDIRKPKGFKSISDDLRIYRAGYDGRVIDVFQTSKESILVRVMFTSRGRSYLPQKGTPYFLYLINIENGQIIKELSLSDDSIYTENFYGKIVRINEERIIFKTFENIYVFDNNIETIKIISLKERSFAKLRDLVIIGKHGNTMFFKRSWGKEKEIISFDFGDDLMLSFKELIKSYKKIKKQNKLNETN